MGRIGRFAFGVAGVLLALLSLLEFVTHFDLWVARAIGLLIAIGAFACFTVARAPNDRVVSRSGHGASSSQSTKVERREA